MKRYLLWAFERGSLQYDVICAVILAFIFITPSSFFDDRPDWMRINATDPIIRQTKDDDGYPVWVVKVAAEQDAVNRLKAKLGQDVTIFQTKPVRDSHGRLVAHSFWVMTETRPKP
jgi:hypothetical protein